MHFAELTKRVPQSAPYRTHLCRTHLSSSLPAHTAPVWMSLHLPRPCSMQLVTTLSHGVMMSRHQGLSLQQPCIRQLPVLTSQHVTCVCKPSQYATASVRSLKVHLNSTVFSVWCRSSTCFMSHACALASSNNVATCFPCRHWATAQSCTLLPGKMWQNSIWSAKVWVLCRQHTVCQPHVFSHIVDSSCQRAVSRLHATSEWTLIDQTRCDESQAWQANLLTSLVILSWYSAKITFRACIAL